MDYLFLPNLLKLCSEVLNHDNHHGTIITETIVWARDIMHKGGLLFPNSDNSQIPKLIQFALEDTKRSSFADDDGRSVIEYLDNSCAFFNFLRAMFHAQRLKRMRGSGSTYHKPTIPVIKELENEFQLRLRDGIRNENRIVFFKPAVNRRRVNYITGLERYLEWVPLQKK
jgi:hypothetical protein